MGKKTTFILLLILAIFVFLEASLFLVRAVSERQLDDVTPGIPCEKELLEKSDVLFVIPKFNGTNIGSNDDWCEEILLMNKKIGLHGVYHVYNEFYTNRSDEYIDEGIVEFEKCFGKKPEVFKAPQLALSNENENRIEASGMKVYGYLGQLTHKVYHCEDTGLFPNRFIDLF